MKKFILGILVGTMFMVSNVYARDYDNIQDVNTLLTCLKQREEGVCTLGTNLELSDSSRNVYIRGPITLNTKGFTLTLGSEEQGIYFSLSKGAGLNITGGGKLVTNTAREPADYVLLASPSSNVSIDDVKIEAPTINNTAISITSSDNEPNGNFKIGPKAIIESGKDGVRISSKANGTFNIYGSVTSVGSALAVSGTITEPNNAQVVNIGETSSLTSTGNRSIPIYINGYGTVNILGGTHTGNNYYVVGAASKGNINIKGGTYNTRGEVIGVTNTVTLSISGGTFNSTGSNALLFSRGSQNGNYSISGGTFNGGKNVVGTQLPAVRISDDAFLEKQKGILSGGKYLSEIFAPVAGKTETELENQFVKEGYEVKVEGDYKTVVLKSEPEPTPPPEPEPPKPDVPQTGDTMFLFIISLIIITFIMGIYAYKVNKNN